MKMNTLIRILRSAIISSLMPGAVLPLLLVASPAHAVGAAELLEKGIYLEETKGELHAASRLYREIVEDPGADRRLAAQAQLRLGLCELKQGNKPQAVLALERLTVEFPESQKLQTIAGQPMPQLLDEIVKQIQQNYIQEVDGGQLVDTAIRAIIGKLDAGAGFLRTNDVAFMNTNEMAELNLNLEQKLAGIGAQLKVDEATRAVIVESPLPDSPALRGGLRTGDQIVEVDGSRLPDTNQLAAAVKLLRGPAGTHVTAGVKRAGSDGLLNIEMVRDTVRLASVLGDHRNPDYTWDFMLDDQNRIGYVHLAQLGKQSPAEMRAALQELQAKDMQALVLDLRNNPGGALASAVAVAGLFIESGRIVTVKGRTEEQAFDAKPGGAFLGFNIAVLVNRETASAAEIVAACLQDHQRAVVVGERTFGQGLVRSLIPLKGDAGALKLPVAAYYRPSGKNMNRFPDSKDSDDWGIRPDDGLEVVLDDEEFKAYEKYGWEHDKLNQPDSPKVEFQDRQLQRALDYLLARPQSK